MIGKPAAFAVLTLFAPSVPTQAAVTISTSTTQNMVCSSGVCAPTASSATLNATDLENLLATGDTTVSTTGSSGIQARDIVIKAGITWGSRRTLSLDTHRSVIVNSAVVVSGRGGLSISMGVKSKDGDLFFGRKGHVTFANTRSTLFIDGTHYVLVDSIASLASAAGNGSDRLALANSYDASGDGIYTSPPLPSEFLGIFEGLGNSISNFSLHDVNDEYVGLFANAADHSFLRDVSLVRVDVSGNAMNAKVGALVALDNGNISGIFVSGVVRGGKRAEFVGGVLGLSGDEFGTTSSISNSYSSARVFGGISTGGLAAFVGGGTVSNCHATGSVTGVVFSGGLIGETSGFSPVTVSGSFATGSVSDVGGPSSYGGGVGGLIGANLGTIENSYATGAVTMMKTTNPSEYYVGGLVGVDDASSGAILDSYSTGAPTGPVGSYVGGLVGYVTEGTFDDAYWDLDASGIRDPSQGAGNVSNEPGVTGLTTLQFQSGLPSGFDPKVWAEGANINNGLPYLINNPPRK